MENNKLYVGVHVEFKDNKAYFKIDSTKGISLQDMQAVLAGGLNLTIRCENSEEEQYKSLKKITRHMESELFNDESFKDLHIGIKKY
jgi:hypothetical protein